MEEVTLTTPEEETKKYRKSLFKITQFKAPEYRPRTWRNEETKKIPLESQGTLSDPWIKKWKIPATFPDTEKTVKKTRKPCKDPELPGCSSNQNTTEDQKIGEDPISTIEGIVLHITDSELNLFPEKPDESKDANLKEDCTNVMENRRVYLNNNWQVKDSIGSPAFQGIIEEDPNIDWLTFISENINFQLIF